MRWRLYLASRGEIFQIESSRAATGCGIRRPLKIRADQFDAIS